MKNTMPLKSLTFGRHYALDKIFLLVKINVIHDT